ncbi:hypothetical protein ACIOWG_11865 [Streptomyces sp. NPDC087658]|uniref:hypothetical protein n=1 Tax=Streptomyces sp. NPDC087658 TaxID=3365800 RepID=UPI003804A999
MACSDPRSVVLVLVLVLVLVRVVGALCVRGCLRLLHYGVGGDGRREGGGCAVAVAMARSALWVDSNV